MQAVKQRCWPRLITVVLAVLLLAGVFSLMSPATALAAGGDIVISGPGLNNPEGITVTQNQLRGTEQLSDGNYLEQQDVVYSTINTWPTKSWYRGVGVKLSDLLDLAGGLNPDATLIRFTAGDGFKTTFTVQEFISEPRYFFPNFMDTGIFGHIPGDPSGAVPVDTIIAHKSFTTHDFADILDDENLSRSDANHLLFGQRAVTQQTNSRFAKYVVAIEVLTDPVIKWDNPTANPEPGVVPAGTMVELSSLFNDEDKVHYTLDGSDPTIESPMYNWVASRWWSSRSDDLDEINHPVEITQSTTIKAFVTGPGRYDSDIVTFEYQVILADSPALTADTSGNTVGQAVDITFTDDADWRAAITDVIVNGNSIAGQYTVTGGNLNIAAGVFTAAGDYAIVVKATGYTDALVTQTMVASAPKLVTPEVTTKGDISLTFDKPMADPTGIGSEEQFEVFVDGDSVDVSAVLKTNTAEKIKLELATKIVGGQTVTAAYTKSSDENKQIKSTDGGVLESFSAVNVTNGLALLAPPALTADTTDNTVGQAVDITFTDDADWRAAITDVIVNGNSIAGQYTVTGGNLNIAAGVFTAAGDYSIVVKATGYSNASVTQTIELIEFVVVDGVLTAYMGAGGDVVIPDNLGITAIGDAVFRDLTTLTSVTIPEGVTGIGASAFRGCSNLTTVTIPDSVTSIGIYAFADCAKMTSVTIPGNVATIGTYAFSGCSSLVSIAIPDGVTSLESNLFRGCSSLVSVTIPESVTSLKNSVFMSCSSLTSINIPNTVTSMGNAVFNGCSSLVSISIPDSVTSMGTSVFHGCSSLSSITLPNNITSITDYTFYNCSSLTTVTIPDTVTKIGSYAFRYCTNLTSVTIPGNVTSIGSYTFSDCVNLTSVTIPSSVTSIANSSFNGCSSLTIYGYTGSYAQTYAADKGIPFVALDAKPHIVSITDVGNVEVPYGAAETEAIAALASETTIMDSDGVTHTVALTWNIAEYDGNAAGGYTATGTFQLPTGVEQSDPPMALEVTATVTVLPPAAVAPVADFTSDVTSGTEPLTVSFTDQSTGTAPLVYEWDFDSDGTVDSTEQNPAYTYNAAGTYTVTLKVTNAAGSDVETKADYITVTTPEPQTWYVDDSGGADFTTIQAAVTAARAGDTIIVKDGAYTENVVVEKSLVIKSENGAAQTIVQAANPGADVFRVTAADVTIDGFTATGATSMGKSGVTIFGPSSVSCVVKNNESSGNNQGITIEAGANNNTVTNNTVVSSGRYGIYLTNTTGNSISGNTCSNNTAGSGFALYLADNANNNTVNGNTSNSNTIGIRVKNAYNNTIFDNNSANNNFGLEIATGSKVNMFYLNNFTGNISGQLSAGFGAVAGNTWNSQEEQTYEFNGAQYTGYMGNYWSNYTGADADGNGIGDTPIQTISTDSDNYPLMGYYQDGVITVPAVAPVAAFTADPTSGTEPLTVSFTDQSTGTAPLAYEWDFDSDGTVDSTEQNPAYTYNAAGAYTVTLKVTNSAGSDVETKADYITVSPAPLKTPPTLSADSTENYVGMAIDITFINDDAWLGAITGVTVNGSALSVGQYTVTAGNLNIAADVFTEAGDYSVVVIATGYEDASVTQGMVETPSLDILYDGTVNLNPDETFKVTAYNSGTEYTVYETTPLGALRATGLEYNVTDKNYASSGALLLDDVGSYPYVKGGSEWYAYVNGVYKDGFNNAPDALNLIQLVNGDRVEFYYADASETDIDTVKAAATAAVKTVASIGATYTDWTLQLSGAKNQSVTKSYFEDGLACTNSGHYVEWEDVDGNVWGGVPLWLLVGMVDDDPDVGPSHFNFNDELAAQNYEVNVIAGDGWKATLDSAAIARNDGYIIANTLNGEELPRQTEGGKGCWPLHLKGSAVFGGQQVGNIVKIELSSLPQPPEGWTLELTGDVGDIITQAEFEEGLACTGSGHYREWTDNAGNVWSGVPLWVLLGAVDDIEKSSHWTFNDTLAADGYTVNVIAEDGFSRSFDGTVIANSDDYIVANKVNGAELTDAWPLRLVGNGVKKADGTLGGSAVGKIKKIEIPELMTSEAAPGSWNLVLKGKISDVISQAEFEDGLACPNSGHYVEWTDVEGNKWSGIPLWFLAGWVDDRQPHDYDYNQAMAGYTVLVKAGDGYTKDFDGATIAKSNDYIIANKINGEPLAESSKPLRLVGAGVTRADGTLSGTSVGNITEIELTAFNTVKPIPELRIVKYAEDRTTIIDEITVDYQWMENESGLDVIGDGTTVYKFEGITNNPDDVWDADETYPGGFKIINAVKGTRIRDLCELVGGMGAGTEIILVAGDGFETRLPYSSIYPDPSVQERQGDAILAWWADGEYVPYYKDGMRLFFTPGGDHVYGQWDMHETLPENYWHYYYSDGVQYPSCAGLSAKYIEEIKIYSVPAGDWTLKLDGRDIGGIQYDVSKTYFEQALACQFGANHKAAYTDSKGRVWEGMPLWFLVGFVDDDDQHSDNAFNDALAAAGYQVVITAADDHSVTVDSADIIRNSDYIVANTLNELPIPETDSNWPLRLVGPAVSGATSISQIVSIDLISQAGPFTPPTLAADTADNYVGQAVDITFTDDAEWRTAITGVSVNGSVLSAGQYTFAEGNLNIAADVFTETGDYVVVVTATGYTDAAVTQTMVAAPEAPTAAFSADPTSGTAPLTVSFTDQSTGTAPLAYEWDFDSDGTVDSTEQNPAYTYDAAGAYTVTLKVTNAAGSDVETKTDYIAVSTAPEAPTAAFSADPTSGTAPLTVNFTDQSTGTAPLAYEWDFDSDGTVDSTEQNPAYTYDAAGAYTVTLKVTNAAGSDVETKTGYIAVSPAGLLTPPVLNAGNVNKPGKKVDIKFTDDADWRAAVDGITVDGSSLSSDQYTLAKGKIRFEANVFTAAGDYEITVQAGGYEDATVIQTISSKNNKKDTPEPPAAPVLTADNSPNNLGKRVDITFTDDADWRAAVTGITVDGSALSSDQYTLAKGKIRIEASAFPAAGDYEIAVQASGYEDATVIQTISSKNNKKDTPEPPAAPVLTADNSPNNLGKRVDITFTDDADWRAAVTGITVDGSALSSDQYTLAKGKIRIEASAFPAAGDYEIAVQASGYEDATVIQTISSKKNK